MTHDELVVLSARWLRTKKKLPVVLQDVRCMMVQEQPDAIGWSNSGFSILVECKVSKADFARDADKQFRKVPDRGMGRVRYYAFPRGLLVSNVPVGWGILEAGPDGRVKEVRRPKPFDAWNNRDERVLLVQAVRKVTEGWGRRTFGDIAPPMVDGDPHPTASKLIKELRNDNFKLRKLVQESALKRAAEEVVLAQDRGVRETDAAIAKLTLVLADIAKS